MANFNFQQLMQQALALMSDPKTWAQGMAMMNQLNSHRSTNAQMAATITGYIAQIQANPSSAQTIITMAGMTPGLPDSVKLSLTGILPIAEATAKAKATADALGATAQDKALYAQEQAMLMMTCQQVISAVQTAQPTNPTNPFPFPFPMPTS